ncbi:Cof-type HAD-IIB family hydrolase [Vibrio algarum]|uniref:Cof-type HAD-IIB family hydrolase n=1 Tax=Vibrio algarum TaxID=3020714 RepID=A0ABT4YUD2_9VIBR|nr:Cof-type HAD-IIB family hydrolase [Vibrio sp. KJ40-1]MDB1124982.1 Cof-type HAD-IIB family hydrolase [Vibrio sp. KJ40-1]
MSQNNVKFIAADMDGTLLNEMGALDPEFFNVYQQLSEKGIIFAAASGRQYYSLMQTFSPIKNDMMFIAENGTLVMHQEKELYSCTIGKSSIVDIITQARSIDNAHIVLCGKKSAYVETQAPNAIEEIQKYYHRCEYVEDLLNVEDDFIKVAICHFDGSEAHVYPSINEKFGHDHKVVVSAKIWLDVMNAKASKGAAIEHLQKTLGFGFNETMSFGDYFNDVEMLETSYYSYAMENAHEGVKKYARFSAPCNRDSGVLTVIKQSVLDCN